MASGEPGRRSLFRRLFVLAASWSTLGLALAGLLIAAAYRESLWRGFDDRLDLNLKTLIGAVAVEVEETGAAKGEIDLGDTRFRLPLSGWYWVIREEKDGRVASASESLVGEAIRFPSDLKVSADEDGLYAATVDGPEQKPLRVLERRITFAGDLAYRVAVAGDTSQVEAELTAFTLRLVVILAAVGFGLVLSTIVLVRLGLRPLRRMSQRLSAIRAGEATRLEGRFPEEIEPLAQELNALIEANREVVERARTHVGNLAHALKTPLSVIVNEARIHPGLFADRVSEQAEIMRTQVAHHLERARLAAQARVIGVVTDVGEVAEKLVRVMRRIHGDRGIDLELDLAEGLKFRGERQDLEECLANLVDNACKWAALRVDLAIAADPEVGPDGRRMLVALIDDDGPGLSPGERAEATVRGRRLDERVPGSGLGLSIVTELAALYGGGLTLEDSPRGGLRCRLRLPIL